MGRTITIDLDESTDDQWAEALRVIEESEMGQLQNSVSIGVRHPAIHIDDDDD